jgi:hypothetical protein
MEAWLMASLVDELNDLVKETRAGFEAAQAIAEETEIDDPDIESGLEDIMDGERWSSSGLYHRITQLDGTPNLLTTDLAELISDKNDLLDKLSMLCRHEENVTKQTKTVLSRDDLDDATRQLLTEMRELHSRNAHWCRKIMAEWKPG